MSGVSFLVRLGSSGKKFFELRKARKVTEAGRQRSILERLFRPAVATGAVAGAPTAFRAVSSLLSQIKDVFGGPDTERDQAALDQTSAQVSAVADQSERPAFERINVADLFKEVKVDRVSIVPELGPEEDKYQRHLNLIIERVAHLESEVATQNNLINKLRGGTKEVFEQNRRADLEEKRRRSEDDIEQGFIRRNIGTIGDKVKSITSDITGAVSRAGKTIAAVAALFLTSNVLSETAESDEERQKRSYDIIRDWFSSADEDDEFSDVESKSSDQVEELVRSLTTETAATAGAARGSGLRRFFAGATAATPTSVPGATVGQTVTMTNARGVQSLVVMDEILDTVDSRGRPQVRVTPDSGGASFAVADDAITGGVDRTIRPTTTATATGALTQSSRKANIFRRSFNKFANAVRAFVTKSGQILNALKNGTGFVLKATARYFSRVVLGLFVLYEAVDAIRRNIQMFGSDEMTEEEFHIGNKEQINRIIGQLGLPIIAAFVGAKFAGIIGAIFGLGVGGLPAAIIGFIAGLVAGIGAEQWYRGSALSEFIDSIYDSIFMDDDGRLKGLIPAIEAWMEKTNAEKAVDVAKFAFTFTPTGLGMELSRRGASALMSRIRPQQSIAASVAEELDSREQMLDSIVDVNESVFQQNDPETYSEYVQFRDELERQIIQQSDRIRYSVDDRAYAARAAKEQSIDLFADEILASGAAIISQDTTQQNVSVVNEGQEAASMISNQQMSNQGRTIVVPIMQPAVQYGQSLTPSMATGPKSQLESASPSYNTSDSFLDFGSVT